MMMMNPFALLFSRSAKKFVRSLRSSDIRAIRLARRIFIASSFLNLALYWSPLSPDAPPAKQRMFPCTISWTIRKGFAKWANVVVWTSGWWQILKTFMYCGDMPARVFAIQMYAVGLVVCFFAPVGQGPIQDKIHTVGAGLYFVYHCVLFEYMKTAFVYRAGFYASFYGFVRCLLNIRKVESDYGFINESDYYKGTEEEQRNTARMSKRVADKLWWQKLGQMVFENIMLLSFTVGMTSGLTGLPSYVDPLSN